MKIERGSITITDLPYFDSIEIMPSGILLGRGASKQTHALSDLEELRDALTEAIRIKREIDGTPATALPRVFNAGATEPGSGVMRVRDCDGSDWYRGRDGWSLSPGTYGNPWSEVLQYEPLTDVTNA